MESAVEASEARSDSIGEKRAAEELDVSKEDASPPPPKRSRGASERRLVGDVRKVAEMVMVLAAMGKMRGGKGPSDVEKELMAEARNKLAQVCEGFAPKDVFPRDAFGGVIEDLGLNRLKEQRLGFRPPKMSIAEKLVVSKKKMEKAENFSLPSTPPSSRLHPNSGSGAESRNPAHPVRMPQSDKSSHIPMSSGSFHSPSPLAHTTTAISVPLPYQLPTSEIRPVVSSGLPPGHLNSAALPRVDRPHIRSDGRPNGSSHPPQIQGNYSASATVRTPTWSMQPQPAFSSKPALDNKGSVNMSLKVEGVPGVISGMAPQTTVRAVASQTLGPPSQGIGHVQPPPLGNIHSEIGKIIQKLLQPRVSERPTWIPPSRDYMNKALTCQICMSTVTEIDSILICDACEKGYHLKCLQAPNHKGIPRGEWHCGKCLSLSNGKPLPPKYGRVMRNVNTAKPSAVAPSTSSKLQGTSEEKNSQTKAIFNGNSTMENSSSGVVDNNHSHPTSGSERKESNTTQENDNASIGAKMDNMISSGTCPNNLINTSGPADVSVNSDVVKDPDLNLHSSTEPAIGISSSDKSQTIPNAVETSPAEQSLGNNLLARDSKESHGDESSSNADLPKEQEVVPGKSPSNADLPKEQETVPGKSSSNADLQKEQEVVPGNLPEIAANVDVTNQDESSSESLISVNWVGDPVQISDEKFYYSSCRINGNLYKLMDHVLIRSDKGKLIPSKLQAMWQDNQTTAKWVTVNQCYFPTDLPETVGRPCGLESSEVYGSTCSKSLMASLIEGPCEVLPPRRFNEESDRRLRSEGHINDHLPQLYLCKWIYDEAKGLFRDISC